MDRDPANSVSRVRRDPGTSERPEQAEPYGNFAGQADDLGTELKRNREELTRVREELVRHREELKHGRRQTGTDEPARSNDPQSEDHGEHGAEAGTQNDQQALAKKPFYRRPVLMLVLIVVVVGALVATVLWWLHARHFENTDDAFIDGTLVQMAPKVDGYVLKLHVTDNQLVHKGDLLLEIDPCDFQLTLDQAHASEAAARERLAQAEVQITTAQAQVVAAEGDLKATEASAENAARDLERNRSLVPRAVSPQQLDALAATAKSTAAQEQASRARLAAARTQVSLAEAARASAAAALVEAQVQVRQAELNLSYTRVEAPIIGRVTRRGVEQGDYVTRGQSLFALVSPNVWVTANFKETQLTDMRTGQDVTVRIDAYPDHDLAGHIDSFQHGSGARFSALPAENATGNYVKVVQRVPVKIVFDDPIPSDMILGPGMSAEPRVRVR